MSNNNEQLNEQQEQLTPEQQRNKEQKKVEKRYNESIVKLTALLGGNLSLVKAPKVGTSNLDELLEDILKERREAALNKFKVDALSFFDRKVAFDKLIKQKEEEFQKEITKAKKEFADEADKLFNQLEGVNEMVAAYRRSLNPQSEAPAPDTIS